MTYNLESTVDTERFVSSQLWQKQFTNLTSTELKCIALLTLVNRPNCTSRKTELYEHALYLIKVRTSRQPKKEFNIVFNRAVNSLIKSRIVKEYNTNSEFPRLRFDISSQKSSFESLLRQYYGHLFENGEQSGKRSSSSRHFSTANDFKKNETAYEYDSYINNNSSTNSTENSDDLDSASYFDNATTEPIMESTDSELEDYVEFDDPSSPPNQSEDSSESSAGSRGLQHFIVSHFQKMKEVTIEDTFSEIMLIVNEKEMAFSVLIEIDSIRQEVQIKSIIPFLKDAVIDILKRWSHFQYNFAICIEPYDSKESFVVKKYVDQKRYDSIEIIAHITNIIKASKQTCEVIKKFL